MIHRPLAVLSLLLIVSGCSTGGGGTVLPSPLGDAAVGKACRNALPDIIPSSPILTPNLWMNEGHGSAADALEALRMGFERVSFEVTPSDLASANALSSTDANRWSQVPLTTAIGTVTLEVTPRGDPRCTAFEREVEAARNNGRSSDDPMKYWTDTRHPPAPPEGRNWCVAAREASDSTAPRFTRTVTNSQEGTSNVTVMIETLTDPTGSVLARRTQVRMYRPSFPIGISSVGTGCDGRTVGGVPEFFGTTGIGFRAAAAPTLINR